MSFKLVNHGQRRTNLCYSYYLWVINYKYCKFVGHRLIRHQARVDMLMTKVHNGWCKLLAYTYHVRFRPDQKQLKLIKIN